jgi:DNA-binding transcriptional LysR family regulator
VPLYTDMLVLIAAPGHRLAGGNGRHQARLGDLAGEVLVLFGRSSSHLDFTTAMFRQAGVLLGSVIELDNIEAAKKMVERGLGVSLVPSSTLATELAAGTLTAYELVDASPARREIVAVRRRDAGPPSGAVAVFLDMLTELEPPG